MGGRHFGLARFGSVAVLDRASEAGVNILQYGGDWERRKRQREASRSVEGVVALALEHDIVACRRT